MQFWTLIAWKFWKATKYLSLIVFSSIVGAHLGSGIGAAFAGMTGEPNCVAHGRCAGWTLFFLVAAVGAPFGFVHFCTDAVKRRKADWKTPTSQPAECETAPPVEGQTTEGGIKAFLIAPLIGGFGGLIVGCMAAGCLVALYFFAALSPLGAGGWWPILPLAFQSSGDGFSSKDSFILTFFLIIVGTCVILGALLGFFGSASCGKKRFQIFCSNKG